MIVSRKQAEEACEILGWGRETLGTDEGPSVEGVNAQYRTAAKAAHPDAGGSAEAFAAVDRAKHVLLEWLKRQGEAAPAAPAHGARCERCEGRGYVFSQRAFRSMRVQCVTCRGSGELGVEQEKGDSW